MTIITSPEGPKPGWIYCIANPASPGLVKIGCTAQEVDQRMAELDTTGVAMPFSLIGKWLSADIRRDEKAIHAMLAPARARQSREWFVVSDDALIDMVCVIGQYMARENNPFYNPPENFEALATSSWLVDLGIASEPIGQSFAYRQMPEASQFSANANIRSTVMACLILGGGIFASFNMLV